MKKTFILFSMLILLSFSLIACGNEVATVENQLPVNTVTNEKVVTTPDPEPISEPEPTPEPEPTSAIEESELAIGKIIPNYALETLSGETVYLKDYQGKIVLLNFWTTWCPYCVEEMPDLSDLNQEDDVVVLAINSGETLKTINGFLDDHDYDLEIIVDEDGYYSQTFYVTSLPTTFFINEEGILLGSMPGMMTAEQMNKIIQDIRDDVL